MPPTGPILFFRPGGLGDLLAACPSIRLVRGAFPARSAMLAASGAPGRLAVRAGLADELLSVDDPNLAGLFSAVGGPALPAGRSGGVPDSLWAFFLKEPPPEFRMAAARLFGPEARIIVYEPSSGLPIGRFFFERAAATFGGVGGDAAFDSLARLADLGPPPFPLPAAPFAVIHPGSGSARKNWPLERFLAAAAHLGGRGVGGFLVTGPAEAEGSAGQASPRLPTDWLVLREPPLHELAGLLARCGVYLGNDSGVTHLAATAGAPVLALFRDENLPAWQPAGRTTVLHAPEPSGISWADVRAALARFPAPSALQYRP
ncbi:MAG: hypothetical protein NTZ26_00780 [Candidatus Aminicenantes bacterium]|nr:hypothetical protein [Candidatus Aminicenantes bacterium]